MLQNRTTIRFAVAIAASVIAAPALAQQEPCLGNSVPLTGPAAFGGLAVKYGAETGDRRDQ
jgi:branched-chain amino acid transport system substrate-binding protein